MKTPVSEALKCWLDAGLSFFYPEVCQYFDQQRAVPRDGYICESCAQQASFITPPFCERCGLPFPGEITTPFECSNCRELELHFCSARSAVAAQGMVLDLIHRYKYHAALWLEPYLGRLFTDQAIPALQEGIWDMIVPVPLHRSRELEREFNQAERLARVLSRATALPVQTRCLERINPTKTQTRLSRTERTANVRAAFRLLPGAPLQGKKVVLVDDVFTTGATTSACAAVLRKGGAAEVCVWTLARGVFH